MKSTETTIFDEVKVHPMIIEYCHKYGKNKAYLLNNKMFSIYSNPSELRKAEYNKNYEYIKNY